MTIICLTLADIKSYNYMCTVAQNKAFRGKNESTQKKKK